LSYILNFHKII